MTVRLSNNIWVDIKPGTLLRHKGNEIVAEYFKTDDSFYKYNLKLIAAMHSPIWNLDIRTNGLWGWEIVKKSDLILYSHYIYKTKKYFKLMPAAKSIKNATSSKTSIVPKSGCHKIKAAKKWTINCNIIT